MHKPLTQITSKCTAIWITFTVLITVFFLYIVFDFSCNAKMRATPSGLMLARSIFNYIAALIVLITISNPNLIDDADTDSSTPSSRCEVQAAAFLFSLYMAAIYYALIGWELYLIIKNPFRAPSSGSVTFHVTAVLLCLCIVITLAARNHFQYRETMRICFIEQREHFNVINLILIYIPVFGICVAGLIATGWSVKGLKSTRMDATYELRWLLIKQQTSIVTCYTINYILQGINWSLLFFFWIDKHLDKHPLLLSVFCFIAVSVDFLTWIIRKNIQKIWDLPSKFSAISSVQHHMYGDDLDDVYDRRRRTHTNRRRGSKEIKNISDALRKEVISCIIEGLAQCIKGAKPKQSELSVIQKDKDRLLSHDDAEQLDRYRSMDEYEDEENRNTALLRNYEGGPLSIQLYPKKMGGKCVKDVIDEYHVNMHEHNAAHQQNGVFRDYAPRIFSYLRRTVYRVSDEAYYESILPENSDANSITLDLCTKFSEGRSGAFFFFTKDMRYLIKTLSKSEAQLLLDTLQKYVNFMRENPKTYLSKYFGLHSIELYGHTMYFVVSRNVYSSLNGREPDERYDIKGSWIDRNTNHDINDKKLMKDCDLNKKLLLNRKLSYGIYKQLEKDSTFLAEQNIMDYSLLLGICYTKVKVQRQRKHNPMVVGVHVGDVERDELDDSLRSLEHEDEDEEYKRGRPVDQERASVNEQEHEVLDAEVVEGPGLYCIGIIDMLQRWNWNKKAERAMKAYVICKDKNGISCIPPNEYKDRFLEKMIEIGIGHESKFKQPDDTTSMVYSVLYWYHRYAAEMELE